MSITADHLKPWSLLLLRIGTGLLLVLWGTLRVSSPDAGPGLAEKYYSGLLDQHAIQIACGAAEILIGTLIAAGLFRRIVCPLQALILIAGAMLLWSFLLDPLGWYLLDKVSSQILFFPSITVAAATLVLMAFRNDDRLALDERLSGERAQA